MTLAEFRSQWEATSHFVRLHGWVNQTEERLTALRKGLPLEDAGGQVLVETLVASLEASSSPQEKLLCLFLLHDVGWEADRLAGLLFQSVQGQMDSTDGPFFARQFFPAGPPIPSDVSKLITDRVYLTHQRAILQAMKIEEFDSMYSAQEIVLFMTQLLCRIDLNEQNRTMLYLLLSRIDAELPEALDLAVAQAMTALREIILDVERRRDKVLTDQLNTTPPPAADPWAPRGRGALPIASPSSPTSALSRPAQEAPRLEPAPSRGEPGPRPVLPPTPTTPPPTLQSESRARSPTALTGPAPAPCSRGSASPTTISPGR